MRRVAIVLVVLVAATGCGGGDGDGERVASVAAGADAALTTSTSAEPPSTTNAPTTSTAESVPTTTVAPAPTPTPPAPVARPALPAPPAPPTTTTTAPAPPQLSARIELPTRTVVAGGSLDGTLVVTNAGAAPAHWLDRGCKPKWAVYLWPGDPPAFHLMCEGGALVFPPGETRLPFTVRASLTRCGQDESSGGGLPRCLPPPDVMPPLDPGTYRAALYTDAPGLSAAKVPVEVVPA
jgi:hypothetical protein